MAVGTYLKASLSISIFLAAIGGAAASQPTQATNPNPADGAIDVSVDANLSWVRGDGADEDEVYFGTDPCALPKVAHIIVLPMNPPLYNPGDPNLIASTTYYWQVVEVNGPDRYEGDIWEFTTIRGEAQPDYPSDGALIKGDLVGDNISTNLEFIPGATTVEYKGYFSEDYSKVESRHADANLGPPPYGDFEGYEYMFWAGNPGVPPMTDSLVRGTKYYWTVDSHDYLGNTFYGDVWEFAIQGFNAGCPNPPNEATFVSVTPLLSWCPGYGVEDYDIYIGTSWEDVNNGKYPIATRSEPYYQVVFPLPYNTKLYWRVDGIGGRSPPLFIPKEFYKGDVWCFTTIPRRIFVDIDAGGANNGTSWENAYNFLQDALADANSGAKPVKIMVAEGIYTPDKITPGDGLSTFQLKNGVAIKGGYAGFGEADPNVRDIDAYETILSGYMCFGELCYNSCHVVTSIDTDETAILDGFTITGGNAECWYENDFGGGIYNDSGNPTIINCTFTGNTAYIGGGGMYNREGSPTLTNCTFIHNGVVEHAWEGMPYGSGFSNSWGSPKLINCIFIGNMSMVSGGGMRNYGGSPTLTNCRFIGNLAFYGGGGGMYSAQSTATLNNCIFIGNSAGDYGGGMYNTQGDTSSFTNCTFSANSAARYDGTGGGMFSTESSNPTLSNCIFRGNSDGNGVDESAQIRGGSPVVNYSSVQGWTGGLGGIGNTGADPMFVREPNDGGDGWCDDLLTPDVDEGANDDFGDVHLLAGSPCIETGDPNFIAGPNDVDMDGQPRVVGGYVDVGADEFVYIGDFDFDGFVALSDVGFFVSHWLDTDCTDLAGDKGKWCYGTDVNKDGGVDWHDFALPAANWLKCIGPE